MLFLLIFVQKNVCSPSRDFTQALPTSYFYRDKNAGFWDQTGPIDLRPNRYTTQDLNLPTQNSQDAKVTAYSYPGSSLAGTTSQNKKTSSFHPYARLGIFRKNINCERSKSIVQTQISSPQNDFPLKLASQTSDTPSGGGQHSGNSLHSMSFSLVQPSKVSHSHPHIQSDLDFYLNNFWKNFWFVHWYEYLKIFLEADRFEYRKQCWYDCTRELWKTPPHEYLKIYWFNHWEYQFNRIIYGNAHRPQMLSQFYDATHPKPVIFGQVESKYVRYIRESKKNIRGESLYGSSSYLTRKKPTKGVPANQSEGFNMLSSGKGFSKPPRSDSLKGISVTLNNSSDHSKKERFTDQDVISISGRIVSGRSVPKDENDSSNKIQNKVKPAERHKIYYGIFKDFLKEKSMNYPNLTSLLFNHESAHSLQKKDIKRSKQFESYRRLTLSSNQPKNSLNYFNEKLTKFRTEVLQSVSIKKPPYIFLLYLIIASEMQQVFLYSSYGKFKRNILEKENLICNLNNCRVNKILCKLLSVCDYGSQCILFKYIYIKASYTHFYRALLHYAFEGLNLSENEGKVYFSLDESEQYEIELEFFRAVYAILQTNMYLSNKKGSFVWREGFAPENKESLLKVMEILYSLSQEKEYSVFQKWFKLELESD